MFHSSRTSETLAKHAFSLFFHVAVREVVFLPLAVVIALAKLDVLGFKPIVVLVVL